MISLIRYFDLTTTCLRRLKCNFVTSSTHTHFVHNNLSFIHWDFKNWDPPSKELKFNYHRFDFNYIFLDTFQFMFHEARYLRYLQGSTLKQEMKRFGFNQQPENVNRWELQMLNDRKRENIYEVRRGRQNWSFGPKKIKSKDSELLRNHLWICWVIFNK